MTSVSNGADRPRRPSRSILPGLAVLVVAALAAAPAGAQTVGTLVSNHDETGIGSPRGYAAQSIRTGGQAGGYEITEIRILGARSANPPSEPVLKIRDDDGGEPGDLVATLSNPSHFNTDEAIFRAPSGTMLDANTTYWVMINDGVTGSRINYSLTSGNGQAGQSGWSIGDVHLRRVSEANEWTADASDSVRVHIRGPVTAAPIESGADATLRNLRVRTFTDFYSLRPAFDPSTTSYLVSVPENLGTLYVAPTPSDSEASVRVSPGSRFNSELWAVSVSNGSNIVNVIVTAVDGTEKRYRMNLRARNPTLTHDARLPPDSRLRFLALSADAEVVEFPGEEVEGEDCGCATYYRVVVPKSASRLQVAAMPHGGARVETQFRLERRRSDALRTVSLREGRNEMIVFVYSTGGNQARRALEVYRVMIIRAGSPPKLKDATVTREGHVLLRYDRTLLPDIPGQRRTPGSAFEVTVDRTFVEVTRTEVTQKWLHLTLSRPAGPDAQVRVRYRIPSSNPVRSGKYGLAEQFSNKVARYAGSGLLVFDASANEAPGATVDFKVMLLPAPVRRASVDYETSDGTADAGTDYTATSGTLIFEVGEVHKRISVPVIDDALPDSGETFKLTLSNPINAFLGDAIATGTIYNHEDLTASFGGAPATHGGDPFVLLLQFSEPVGVGWETMSEELLDVTNGRVTRARRVDRERDTKSDKVLSALWEITVEPSGGDVTVELPATADCDASLAVCTKDGRPLSAEATMTIQEGVGLLSATVNAETLVLTFDEALDEASVPAAAAFTVRAGGEARALAASAPVSVSGSTVTLTLASPVNHRDTLTVDYTVPSANPLRSLAGEPALALDGQSLTNRTPDTVAPELLGASATWDAVVLTFDEALDEASVPVATAFTVRVGGVARALAARDPVRVSGSTVTLKFASAVAQGETVTVDYRVPSVNPLRDLAGVAAAAATAEAEVPEREFTVRFEEGSVPETHDGENRVAFRIVFSEEPAKIGGRWVSALLREAVVARIGGDRIYVRDIERLDDVSRRRWQMKVRFQGSFARATGGLTIELGPTSDCAGDDALCTGDGRPLSNRISTRLPYAPSLSVAGAQATEATDAAMDFTVTLSRAASQRVTVDYATMDETATAGADYTAAAGTLTFAPGETEQTVPVAVLDDRDAEGTETLTLTLSNASRASIWDAGATGTIRDDEPPAADPLTVQFRELPASHDGTAFSVQVAFSEDIAGMGYAWVRDTLVTTTGGTVTNARRVSQGSNLAWELTVQPGSWSADMTLTIAAGLELADGRALSTGDTVTIPGQRGLSVADATADEGATAAFRVTLDRAAPDAVTVDYATADGTAMAKSDYEAASGTLTLPAGATSAVVSVPTTADSLHEADETFALTLSGPSVNARLTDATATATIEDDDDESGGPTVTFSRGTLPAGHDGTLFAVKIAFSEDVEGMSYTWVRDSLVTATGGAVANARRVFPGSNLEWELDTQPDSWRADMTLAIAAGLELADGRTLAAGDAVTVPGQRALSVADATAGEGASAEFAVTLDRSAPDPVRVDYATANGTARAGLDYTATRGTLLFDAGEAAKTVTVALLDDNTEEESETFTLTLSNPQGHVRLPERTATGTIEDGGAPAGPSARFTSVPAEHDGATTFSATLEFSEEIDDIGWKWVRDTVVTASNADVEAVRRKAQGANLGWEIDVTPQSTSTVVLEVAPGLRLPDGRTLIGGAQATVPGPAPTGATVAGPLVTLVWATPRDAFGSPLASDYAVRVNGAPRAVKSVALSGRTAQLELALPVRRQDAVTVSYLGSAMHPLADASGRVRSAPWNGLTVTNVTGTDTDRSPYVMAARVRPADPVGTAPDGTLVLDASDLGLADLSALAGMTALERLDLSGNALVELEPLANLGALKDLDLSGNKVEDLNPLSGLYALERLDLSGNRVADAGPLGGLPNLTVLLLDGNAVSDLGPLTHLTRLQNLGLSDNRIAEVTALQDLSALRRLDLGGNPLGDLSPLGDVGVLVWLALPGEPVDDASGTLGRLTQLRWVWFAAPTHRRVE